MLKSRFSVTLSVLLVFLSGALVGAVAHRLYMVNSVSGNPGTLPARPERKQDPEEFRKHLIEEMRTAVKLDDQQVGQVEKVYDQTRERFNEMHKRWNGESHAAWDRQNEEIKAILRPDQAPLFDQLRAKHDAERKARQHKKEGDHK